MQTYRAILIDPDDVKAMKTDLIDKTNQVDKLSNENALLRSQLAGKEILLQQAEARIAELEAELDQANKTADKWADELERANKTTDMWANACNTAISQREAAEARIAELERENENIHDVLQDIRNWTNAYPLDVFPEPDPSQVRELLAVGGITLDCVSASYMRHVLNGVKSIIDNCLDNFPRQNVLGERKED